MIYKILISLFILASLRSVALADPQIYQIKQSRIKTAPQENLDIYALSSTNEAHTFYLPADKVTCENVFNEFGKSIDDKFLYYNPHVAFAAVMMYVNFRSAPDKGCDISNDGYLITWIESYIYAIDAEGNNILRDYVQRISKNKFFDYDVKWEKPIQVINRVDFRMLNPHHNSKLTFFDHSQNLSKMFGTIEEYQAAVAQTHNESAVSNFLKSKVANPEEVDSFIESNLPETVEMHLESTPILLLSGNRTLNAWYNADLVKSQCVKGQCLVP
jgi:hypothetical protein